MVNIPGDGNIGTVGHWTSLGGDWANVGNTPLRFYKNYSFEGGIRTPLIISWPKGLQAKNQFNDFPAHLIDILPTLADLSGANYPKELDGKPVLPFPGQSLLPAIRGEKEVREKPIFWEWSVGRAVRQGNWKAVAHGKDAPWELYDLSKDPHETQNLAANHPEKVRKLKSLFQVWKEVSAQQKASGQLSWTNSHQ